MFGLSTRSIISMVMVTVGVMFAANQLAAMNPMARRVLKGSPVSAVSGTPKTRTA